MQNTLKISKNSLKLTFTVIMLRLCILFFEECQQLCHTRIIGIPGALEFVRSSVFLLPLCGEITIFSDIYRVYRIAQVLYLMFY